MAINGKIMLAIAAIAIVVSGCLLSGTFSISLRLHNLEADFTNGYIRETVDLPDRSSTWEDHEDEIATIEALRMDAIVVNNSASPTTLGVYIAIDSTLTKGGIAANALPVLTGYEVPAMTTDTLTIPEALKLLHLTGSNFAGIQTMLKSGFFTAYALSSLDDASISIVQFNLYITFTTN